MKSPQLFVLFTVTCAAIAGASVASLMYSQPKAADPGSIAQSVSSSSTNQPPAAPQQATPYQDVSPAATSQAQANPFPRQPLTLTDAVPVDSAFYQFRRQLKQAIYDRNAPFVQALIPQGGLNLGFGRPLPPEQLDLANPNAWFWNVLEKSLAHGCTDLSPKDYPSIDPTSEVWACPNVIRAFNQQYPNPNSESGVSYEISRVIVAGNQVNVRTQPQRESPVIGVLSNEVVQFDLEAWNQLAPEERVQQVENLDGWTPVILPNGQRGYVSNKYAYRPLSYQVVFGQVGGSWRIISVPGGD
ncbi:MAG TPA: SH3 domain-containing protein [Trichocoleus sp.]|jgi:hypothetical protein